MAENHLGCLWKLPNNDSMLCQTLIKFPADSKGQLMREMRPEDNGKRVSRLLAQKDHFAEELY